MIMMELIKEANKENYNDKELKRSQVRTKECNLQKIIILRYKRITYSRPDDQTLW